MNHVAKTVILGLLLSAAISGAQAAGHQHGEMMPAAGQAQAISATGEVKIIDMESQKVTIDHDAIPALNWPPMTMRFTITPQTQLGAVKPGDKVAFTFIQQGNLSLLQDIHVN